MHVYMYISAHALATNQVGCQQMNCTCSNVKSRKLNYENASHNDIVTMPECGQ